MRRGDTTSETTRQPIARSSHTASDQARPAASPSSPDHPIVLFDGVCVLCNAASRFVLRHDPPPGRFKLATLQSEAGKRLMREYNLPAESQESLVLIEGGCAYTQSTAALRLARGLGLPWSLAYGFIIVPRLLRDAIYRWIARNRYRWFGQCDVCMMPSEDDRSRFLSK